MPSRTSPTLRALAMPPPQQAARWVRMAACLGVLAMLAACAGQRPQISATQEAAQYQARARRTYTAPGPPGDPWGPYIVEASARYDVPERWVREVMRAESSGKVLDTSPVGAMGLMQVMPSTYDELRDRYGLGSDPYDPRDNVLAGTAYLREMYDLYGFPGFLAAYNAGPGRLDDYLTRNKPLPEETRNYVRKIGPNIVGISPNRPSAGGQYAMNRLPLDIPPGPRYPRRQAGPVALAENRVNRTGPDRSVQATPLTQLPLPPPAPPIQVASAQPSRGGFRLISPAMAEALPVQASANGNWAIQVGAFANEGQARSAAETARGHAQEWLGRARTAVGSVRISNNTLYRARLTGLSRESAIQACQRLGHTHGACIVLSPEAQG